MVRPEPKSNSGALHNTLAGYGKHQPDNVLFGYKPAWTLFQGLAQSLGSFPAIPLYHDPSKRSLQCTGAVIAPLGLCEASLAPPVVRRAGNHEPICKVTIRGWGKQPATNSIFPEGRYDITNQYHIWHSPLIKWYLVGPSPFPLAWPVGTIAKLELLEASFATPALGARRATGLCVI